MSLVDTTFVGLDHLLSCKGIRDKIDVTLANSCKVFGKYVREDSVIKSSVGDFYDENMKFFHTNAKELRDPIKDYLSGTGMNDLDVSLFCNNMFFRLLPLGTVVPDDVWCNDKPSNDAFVAYTQDYQEWIIDTYFHHIPGLRDLIPLPAAFNAVASSEHLNFLNGLEASAHALCAGYAPRDDMPSVQELLPDTENMGWTVLANIMYPWVMQPMSQLRMLISSLPSKVLDNLVTNAIARFSKGLSYGSGFDYGYGFTFDIQSDFITYMDYRRNRTLPFLQRQIWTPWAGFDLPSEFAGLDKKYLDKIHESLQRSDRLYLEMLKTGLRYESQYAVLMGFRGRYCVAGNFGSMVKLTEELSGEKVGRLTNKISSYMKERVVARIPFAAKMFNEGEEFDGTT